MRVNKFFLTGAVALGLGLTACNNDDVPPVDNPAEGTTFAGLSVSIMKNGTTKAVEDNQEDYGGRDPESKLGTLRLLSTADNIKNWTFGTTQDANTVWKITDGYTVKPWKTNPGAQTLALLINPGNNINASIATASTAEFGGETTAVADIAALSTDDSFVMTSEAAGKTVAAGVTEQQAEQGSTETENVFKFEMERVVAQGMVIKSDNLQSETADGKGEVDLDKVTYAAVNGAVKTYLFRNSAGERTMSPAANGDFDEYKDFVSAIDAYTDFEAAREPGNANVKANLIRLGNLASHTAGLTNTDLGGYQAIAIKENEAAAKAARGIYFLENSVDKGAMTGTNKNFGFYRLAYAKVYATYTPKEVLHWENDKLVTKTGVPGETFYKGEKDGLIYASKEAATKSNVGKDQNAYTYKDGRCAYRALWNRQVDDATGKTVGNADVRRNNTYLLKITAFQGLGMPWDSSDPDDPNLPKPDPTDPENPDNPDIEKEDAYMRVEAKVLQWNLVSRDVVLE